MDNFKLPPHLHLKPDGRYEDTNTGLSVPHSQIQAICESYWLMIAKRTTEQQAKPKRVFKRVTKQWGE